MLFNVPQYIDIEDKVVGPLTAKQLGWLGAAGVIMVVLWTMLDFAAFIIASIFVLAIFGSLAFYKPYNQPLVNLISSGIFFIVRPKVYVWKRIPENIRTPKKVQPKKNMPERPAPKVITQEKIEEISRILDKK
jgi:hypothetical protein